jgi:hypothetical protein
MSVNLLRSVLLDDTNAYSMIPLMIKNIFCVVTARHLSGCSAWRKRFQKSESGAQENSGGKKDIKETMTIHTM